MPFLLTSDTAEIPTDPDKTICVAPGGVETFGFFVDQSKEYKLWMDEAIPTAVEFINSQMPVGESPYLVSDYATSVLNPMSRISCGVVINILGDPDLFIKNNMIGAYTPEFDLQGNAILRRGVIEVGASDLYKSWNLAQEPVGVLTHELGHWVGKKHDYRSELMSSNGTNKVVPAEIRAYFWGNK